MSTSTIEKLIVVVTALLEALLKILQKKQEKSEDIVAHIAQVCDENGVDESVKAELIEFV